jgi:hypothetical protein
MTPYLKEIPLISLYLTNAKNSLGVSMEKFFTTQSSSTPDSTFIWNIYIDPIGYQNNEIRGKILTADNSYFLQENLSLQAVTDLNEVPFNFRFISK